MNAISLHIVDLSPDDRKLIDVLVPLSVRAAALNSPLWLPTLEHAHDEIVRVATEAAACRVLLGNGVPRGWIGVDACADTAWEIHPLLVDPECHGCGIGSRLVAAVESCARAAGVLTMTLSTSDATQATTLGGADLFDDPLGALALIDVVDPARGHAFRFWQRVGYTIVGVLPDAEGAGVPSIQLAKTLRPTP